jgi:hypothetical protein
LGGAFVDLASLRRGSAVFLVLALRPVLGSAQGFTIDHAAIGCVVAGKYPAVDACFGPATDLARARLFFRPEGTTSWYYVDSWNHQPPKGEATCSSPSCASTIARLIGSARPIPRVFVV